AHAYAILDRPRVISYVPPAHRSLHSFPTRRSSDLLLGRGIAGLRLVLDHGEGDLAAGVDLADLHLDLLTDLGDILDVVDPLAVVQLPQLGDVEQAVLARGERDEGAEGDHAHDGAEVALADLGEHRVGGGGQRGAGRLGRGAVGGADVHGAVVLDGDVGTGVVLDLVDHLALAAEDRTDLVDRDGDREDARG